MNTEILPHGAKEAPALTAEHMRRAILDAFAAYETDDRKRLEAVIGDPFRFTSPRDDGIDRETYFQRCWPNHRNIARAHVERIFVEGDGAYVTYLTTNTSGRESRNTEYFTFRNGRIASVEVFFGPDYRDGMMETKAS